VEENQSQGRGFAMSKPDRALKPDAQAFDEVRITTIPRYKTSGLSGDEWRISAKIQFMRKGRVVHESGASTIEHACGFLMAEFYRAIDDGKGYYAGEDDLCDQEGCSEQATVTYRVKKRFSRDNPFEWNEELKELTVRKFCARHSKRGDCGFDDADANYELLYGNPSKPDAQDVKPSIFGGTIRLEVDGGDDETQTGAPTPSS
jgi:hypothetical protein